MLLSCGSPKNKSMEETEVLIETSMGDIKVKLYNDTPRHRDNFIKLAKAGVYDNILFHRVVKNFMIQTGDPALKPQGVAVSVDTTDYRYTIPAEIVCPRHFHKKGALAAARLGDSRQPGESIKRDTVLHCNRKGVHTGQPARTLFRHLPKPYRHAL